MAHFKSLRILTLTSLCVFGMAGADAYGAVEEDFNPAESYATSPWFAPMSETQRMDDVGFIKGMKTHHAGALTMSSEYLADPDAKNARLKQLARGIIRNQTFEIKVMDRVGEYVAAPVEGGDGMRRVADTDLAQNIKFYHSPMPGPLDRLYGDQGVSVRDVEFAKAMVVHHQAALDMAQDFLDSESDNGYLQRLCLDILVDQSQEIDFMNSIVALYDGDADAIKIDSSMVHGMGAMQEHHTGH